MMNDQDAWDQATAISGTAYDSLPHDTTAELDDLIDEIMQLKQKLVELVTCAGSSEICRNCGGECCLLGKYHVSVLDMLAYLKTGADAVIPDFSPGPACPYSGESGCLMPPGYRPVTCVIFNCQMIEDRLTAAERETLQRYENRLRQAVARTGRICGTRLDRPLLLSCT
ncbi:MAG: hypothetical protein JJE30_04515 [Desulfuromonadales bacterium]|nr:hypothetical protein [Desulfuromonadales bacterium]